MRSCWRVSQKVRISRVDEEVAVWSMWSTMFPGRPWVPKMEGWARSEVPNFWRREVREGTPSMGLVSVIWKPDARAVGLSCSRPFPG